MQKLLAVLLAGLLAGVGCVINPPLPPEPAAEGITENEQLILDYLTLELLAPLGEDTEVHISGLYCDSGRCAVLRFRLTGADGGRIPFKGSERLLGLSSDGMSFTVPCRDTPYLQELTPGVPIDGQRVLEALEQMSESCAP